MAKQLNVNLAFTADTGKAKTQLESLQKDLDKLLSTAHQQPRLQITKELEEASVVAATLKTQLQEATNVQTGKLDLGKLNEGLSRAGLNAGKIKDALLTLGPAGAQTFAQFAQSVTLAEVPMRRISAKLQEFGTTLKNTARWQISSSILHGFMGTISSAYGYAQDLNKSLNDIRIVTGNSVEEMASFAVQANKAAKALSTTTTEYTNASLIFYQQGLAESEVQKRTDITIKMANAAGASAKIVSDQLTAVWNNFYDGSKSLEYYADVMTALGAATASSTDEIAGGLEKFAAIADTIGLSYEYAAAALATITSNTRQSEEVVGTALKTIFARLQSLKMGETLEDGLDLNKYSEALQKVGVDVLDATGELRRADDILTDMAAKWEALSNAEQVALAQAVGGVRQYNQIVALMDEWDTGDSDSMMANLATAQGAEGALQEQADIYAESWEAASNRVRASAEAIYGALLNDKFFISLNQGFAGFLDIVNDVIDGMGGLKGVLLGLGTIFLKVYQGQIANSINNLIYSLKMLGDTGRNEIDKLRADANKELQTLFSDSATPTGELIGKAYAAQSSAQKDYLAAAQNMSAEQQKIAQILLDQHNTLVQNAAAQGEIAEKSAESAAMEERKQRAQMQKDINSKADKKFPGKGEKSKSNKASYIDGETKRVSAQLKNYQNLTKQAATFKEVVSKAFGTASTDMNKLGKEISTLQDRTAQLTNLFPDSASRMEAFGAEGAKALDEFEQAMKEAGNNSELVDQAITELIATIERLDAAAGSAEGEVSRIVTKDGTNAIAQSGTEYGKLITQMLGLGSATDGFAAKLQKIPSNVNASVTSLVAFGQKLSSIAMGITSVKSLIETWNDTDLTFGEKMLQTLTTLGTVIPILTTAISKDTIAKVLNTVAEKANTAAKGGSTAATWAQTAANWALNASLGPVLVVILAITAALAILIAIGAGISKMWQNWKASTPEGQLKALKEEAEELNSRLEETKQKAEDLKSVFDNYDSVVEKLGECKRGTEEWRNALGDVNDAVLQILEDYPELATYVDSEGKSGVYRDEETGALTVNENWRNEKQTEIDNQILGQTAALQQNQVRQHKINENIAMNDTYNLLSYVTGKDFTKYNHETDETDYSRIKDFTDAYTSGNTDEMKNILGQLDLESLENELRIRMDFDMEGIDYDSLDAEEKRAALIDKLEENHWAEEGKGEEYLQMRLDNLYSSFELSLTNSGLDEALRNYATAIDTTTAAQDAYNDSMAQTLLADNERVQNSKYTDTIIDLSGNKYGELVDSNYEKRLSEITDRTGWFGDVGTDVSKAAMDEYAKLMGLTDDENFKVTNYKANGKIVYDYTGEDGNTASKEVDAETIASALAAADANKQLATSAEALVSTFSKLNEKEAAALTAATSGDTSKLSLNQIQNGVDASTFGLDETDLANLGYETIEALQADLDAAIANALEGWNKTISTYSSGAQAQMNAIAQSSNEAINSISQATLLSYGDMIQSVQQMGGQAAAENMGSALTTLMEENAGKAEEIMQAASGIDWSQGASALNELKGKLFDIGIYIDENSDAWKAFQGTIDGLNTSVVNRDLDSIRTQISEIAKIAKDVEMGDVISDEDYKTLVAYNGALKEMFALTADGYMYIGQDNLDTIAVDAAVAQLKQTKADNEKAIAAQKAIDSLGWRNTTTNEFTDEDWYGLANGTDSNSRMASMAQYMSENKGDAIEALGWDSSYLSELATIVGDTTGAYTSDQIEAAKSQLQEFYGEILQLNANYEQGLYDNTAAEEVFASTLQSLDDLEQAYTDGTISLKTYQKMRDSVFNKEVEAEGFDTEEVNNYVDALIESGKFLEKNREEAQKFALAQKKMDRGMKTLIDSWDDWTAALKSGDLEEKSKALTKLRNGMSDIAGVDMSSLPASFFETETNARLLEQALKGDVDALRLLMGEATKELIVKMNLDAETSGTLQTAIDQTLAAIDVKDLEVGATLNDTGMYEAFQDLLDSGAVTVDEMNTILSGIGFSPVIEYKEMTLGEAKKLNQKSYIQTADGEYTEVTTEMNLKDDAKVWVPVINADKTTIKAPPAPSAYDNGNNGGGGGSKPKKATPTKKSDVVKRYKEVEDKLDDIREEADLVRDSLDRLYGAEHEAAIQRLLELEQQEIDLLKEKEQEARNYLQEDLKELKKVSAEVDVEFKFDDNNNIENYEEEMTKLYEELAEIQRKAGDEWDENEQKEIDALNEKIQKLEEAMAAYEETRELLEDINAELDAFKGKPALPLITSDTLDIYWEINDALDDIDEKIKDLERKAEGLSGEEKLKVLEEINRLEQERVAILQQQAEANQKDIEEKRAALDELARLNGLQFVYDDNNNIINYQEQMGILQAQLDELYAKRTADGLSPAEEEAMNSIIAKMQELADLAGDYRDAVEESEDILNEIEDTLSGMVADPFVRSDFVDIFKETNDQLDDIDRKISKLQNEADKLTGEARRKKLNEIVTLERKRVEILEHQALIAKTEMEDRKRAMEEIAARQELMFEYDENQNITNYQEQLDILIDKYEKAYNEALGDDGLIDATEQAILDAISDDIDHLEEFIQAYCDAVDQLEDIEDEREELANGGYVDMSQLDDIADELHDINQSLDDLQELLDDSARAADRLYGEARIKQMEKNASLLQQEIDLLQQKKTAQDDIIAKEKQQLDEKTGGYIKYDDYGRITNYESYINAREDQIREYEAALQEGGLSETEATLLQDEIDLLNEQIAAMEDYEQALEEKEDIQNQIEDAYYEWQDLNAEKLQYKLELQLDVNDRELAKIERAIKRLDGNFYSRAEALALMVGGGMNGDSKLGNYNKQLADLEAHYQEVKRQYEAGEISQAKYVEMTKELQAEIESTADAMAALQDQMDSYYKDTLAQARQELNFHISQLTHLTGILNHFKNTLTALGKSKDYEMMGTVLEGQVQALENEVKASKNAMQMWQKEADSIYQKYQQALSSGNQENADMYYNAYKEALSAANEAENKFYQQSAAWANALKALMENTLAGLAQDLENALTGGTSFDTITTQMKRASSLQEEYLTTTNKIYETTKLMRTAQQEIDKTTNSVAKQKLSQFITETKQMQNQNKLSKYELSIQQAKYDLLVAEIALEEARFAKSTVRLRRDSEGNFGYVYTADAQAIATAEQKFEDAQNKLYNIGLDGANKYTEKYQQTLAEMYNTLTSLQTKYLQGGFESEAEYNAAVLEAKEYYYEKLNQYSELYSIAINAESGTLTDTLVNNSGIVTDTLTKNSRIAADAWSTDFADMTTKTDQWMVAVTDYLSQVQIAFADWEVESQRIANETVGTDLTTLKNKVNDIVTESDNLTAAIGDENSGVIKAIYDEITAVSGLVTEYANLNGQLTQAIQNALDLSDALQQDIDQAGQDENPPGQYAPGEEDSQKPGTVVPEGTDPLPEIELPEDPDENNPGETEPEGTTPGETEPEGTTPGETTECTHAETTVQEVAPKCEKGGYRKVLCDFCNKMLEDIRYPALGHDYKEGKCTRCGKEDPNWKVALDNKVEGVAAAIWMDGSDVSGWGTGNTRKSRLKEKGVSAAQDYINKHAENGDIYAAWHNKRSQLKQYYYGKFDTGGYTGAWGPEGKWAMLHEKEIVLNKEDTKNFLASLELLDNILSTIDLHAMNSQWASNLISPDVSSIGKETLEQMVNIEASFPNATDKHEIEEAFKDLVNLASQYANRK